MMNVKRSAIVVFISLSLILNGCGDQGLRSLNGKKMFSRDVRSFVGKPIKHLILESNQKLTNFSFVDSSAPFYLDGISLTYANDVKIFVGIEEFKFESFRKDGKAWDINKIILEKAASIKLVSDKPKSYNGPSHELSISFIARDSIVVTKTYDFERSTSEASILH